MSTKPSPCNFDSIIGLATTSSTSGNFLKYFKISSAEFPVGSQEISFNQVFNSQNLYIFLFLYPSEAASNYLQLSMYDETNEKVIAQDVGSSTGNGNEVGFRCPTTGNYTL